MSGMLAQASAAPDFAVSVNPASASLTAGQSGTVVASITRQRRRADGAPCSLSHVVLGCWTQSSCTFTPENVEILPNATAAVNSNMVITTEAGTGSVGMVRPPGGNAPVSWAILLPGTRNWLRAGVRGPSPPLAEPVWR